MEHRESSFKGRRGLSIYYQNWLPSDRPRAILLVVHGLAEHGGRYGNLVNHFVTAGYTVYSFDHSGHGRSEGTRCYVPRFADYLADLRKMIDIIHAEQPDQKIYLVGHSMGGLIAAAFTALYQSGLAGLVLAAPTYKAGVSISPFSRAMAPILSVLLPKMGVTALDASAICRDEAVVSAYINDPLVYRGKVTARLGAELLRAMQRLPSLLAEIKLPVLILQGTADRLTNPKGSCELYELLGTPDKTLQKYEGFYHEVFNEAGREQVFADMEAWLATRV
ncbi:MAG: lysophospholipase [Dehalococcoidales bacterium]|nr:lysophospholipase [Dehalococcoidales bacterium]